jgi:NAD(P)-dependent dehydrogenase (short-subunit alcohol dehydrogenase family)
MRAPGVLVTGAPSGIGLAIAQLLSRSGMRVFTGVRKFTDRPNSQECAKFHEIILDVTKADSIAAARREIQQRLPMRLEIFY